MLKKIINWIKKHPMQTIISLICAIVTVYLVIKGVNIIIAVCSTVFGGFSANVGIKKVIDKNKKLNEEKKEKIDKIRDKRKKANEKINNLSGNALADDVNNKYKNFERRNRL